MYKSPEIQELGSVEELTQGRRVARYYDGRARRRHAPRTS